MMWRPQNASEISRWYHWVVEEQGVYEYTARFEDWNVLYQPSNEARLVVVAEVVPVSVLFDVQPREFTPDTTVTLSAKILNATSNLPLEDFWVTFCRFDENGSADLVGSDLTDGDGVASVPWLYPESGVFVFWAYVSEAQQIMSSPVTLTVGKQTGLSMNVEQGEGFHHTVSGTLLCGGEPVAGKQVVIKVNGTVVDVVTTSDNGSYGTTLNLQPEDNEATNYQVEAVYYGDDALNLTLYDALPDGTEYAVCTTLQYFGYKPSSNAAWLTVEPQGTEVVRMTKTSEQMQTEAEQ